MLADDNVSMTLWCLILTGSPYEMGYAHGQLMQERAKSMMNDVWSYLEDQVVSVVNIISSLCERSFLDIEYFGSRAFVRN